MTDQTTKQERTLKGVVVSNKMDKTAVVSVDRVKTHTKYKKQYTVSTKYQVHDPENKAKLGDTVEIISCRPLSKNKRWRLA
jgi:small subunit ribosomal protein S17